MTGRRVRVSRWFLPAVMVGLALVFNVAVLWPVLRQPNAVLAFNDGNIESVLSPQFRYPDVIFRTWDPQAFFGVGSKQCPLIFTALGECLGAEFWRRWGPACVLTLGALAVFWMLRKYRIGSAAACVAATGVMGSGFCCTFALSGLSGRPIALACTALALGFVEHGRLTRRYLPYAVGGGFLGLGVSEVPDVATLFALTSAAVFWWTHLTGADSAGDIPVTTGRSGATAPAAPSGFRSALECLPQTTARFLLFVVCAGLLGWQTISVMFSTNIQGVSQGSAETPAQRYAWATQWSIPPSETWNTVSGSYFGVSSRSESLPYWGKTGRSEGWEETKQGYRNFSLSGWHLGVVPCGLMLALVFGAARRWRKRGEGGATWLDPAQWWGLCALVVVVSLMLMWGRYFPLYRLFWSLPMISTFRNPDKWNGPLTLFAGLGAAYVLDALWASMARPSEKRRGSSTIWRDVAAAFAVLAGIALLVLFATWSGRSSFLQARQAEGYPNGLLMWNNALSACVKVLAIAGLCAGGMWWAGRRAARGLSIPRGLVFAVIVLMLLIDLFAVNRPYVIAHEYKQFLKPNPLTEFLDTNRVQCRLKLLPPSNPLLNNLRMTILMMKGYNLFDPVSISRMPTDYEALFKAMDAHPIRLWEIGSIRYLLTLPGAVQELERADGGRGRFIERLALGIDAEKGGYVPIKTSYPNQAYLRLVEFTGGLPMYRWAQQVTVLPPTSTGDEAALLRLASAAFDPAAETVVQTEQLAGEAGPTGGGSLSLLGESPVSARLSVEATKPAWLVRSVRFDKDWRATLDGRPAEILRANYLMQAVHVPPGRHTLEFQYRPTQRDALFAGAVRLAMLGVLLIGRPWRGGAPG